MSTTTWNGGAWSNGLPAINRNVILTGDYTTTPASPSFEACSLTISPNRNLIISSGDYVRVQNDLTIGNNAIVDIAHEGSLVMVDDLGIVNNNGTMNIRKTTPIYVEYDYTYWSSPVQNQAISTVFAANQNKKSASSLNPKLEYDLNIIPELLMIFSTSFADSSFAKSAIHLHLGSTLKNEKLKKYCSLFSDMIFYFSNPI